MLALKVWAMPHQKIDKGHFFSYLDLHIFSVTVDLNVPKHYMEAIERFPKAPKDP
jgi:hypothetical protein